MRGRWLALGVVAACGGSGSDADAPPGRPDARIIDATPADAGGDAAGPDAGPDAGPTVCPTADAYTFYLNHLGGTYVPGGADDPATNTSEVIAGPATLPAYPYADWDDVATCIRQALSPFNIQVVETEPSSGAYSEIVFTDQSVLGDGVVAYAPSECSTTPVPHIGFVFSGEHAADTAFNCLLGPSDIGVMTGLSFTTDDCDFMTFAGGCPTAPQWTDAVLPCGDFQPSPCFCGGSTQNSFETMNAAYGACP